MVCFIIWFSTWQEASVIQCTISTFTDISVERGHCVPVCTHGPESIINAVTITLILKGISSNYFTHIPIHYETFSSFHLFSLTHSFLLCTNIYTLKVCVTSILLSFLLSCLKMQYSHRHSVMYTIYKASLQLSHSTDTYTQRENTHTVKSIPKVCRQLMRSKASIQCSAADLRIHSAAQGTAAVKNEAALASSASQWEARTLLQLHTPTVTTKLFCNLDNNGSASSQSRVTSVCVCACVRLWQNNYWYHCPACPLEAIDDKEMNYRAIMRSN